MNRDYLHKEEKSLIQAYSQLPISVVKGTECELITNDGKKIIVKNGGTCTIAKLDMTDLIGIDKLGNEIFNRWKKLDILISNASILGTLSPLSHQSNDEFLDVCKLNLIAGRLPIDGMSISIIKK